MGRFTIQTDLGRIRDFESFVKYTAQCVQQLNTIINGNVEFDSNIMSQTVTIDFTAANTFQGISHSLNKVGLRFIVIDKSESCDVYHKSSLDTLSQIFLACTKATTVKVILL